MRAGHTDFDARIVHLDGEVVVSVTGELDVATAEVLWPQLVEAISLSPDVVIDLAQVSFVDSSGLAVFVRTRNEVSSRHGSVTLRAPNPHVTKVLKLTGIDTVIDVRDQ